MSHFLREVLALADDVTILRDGKLVRTQPAAEESEDSLIRGMLGRPLGAAFPPKPTRPADAPVAIAVRDLHAPGVSGVSLEVRAGEIVGLAGLVGAGRSELARAIFGADRRTAGRRGAGSGERCAPAADHSRRLRGGLAMIPESRKEQGLLFTRSVTREREPRLAWYDLSRGGGVQAAGGAAGGSPRSSMRGRCGRGAMTRPWPRSRGAISRRCCSRAC